MRVLWPTVIAPLLEASRPSTIVDFGGGDEELATLLEEAAREHGGSVRRGAEPWPDDAGGPEFALVHGEPNWYSVTARLNLLSELAAGGEAPLPLTLVHGVDWPTARRDSYPDPNSIPIAARQPHRPQGGVERALDAHAHRNGVLTAVEDFLAETGEGLELVHVPGLGGTAILIPKARLKGRGSQPLARLVKGWRLSPLALAQLATIEAERARADAQVEELVGELDASRAGTAVQSSAELEALRERVEELAGRHAELTEALARRDARLAALEAGRDTAPSGAAGVGEQSQPLPLDRRGILIAAGEEPSGAAEPLHAIVRVGGEAEQLRRCLWSLLARGEGPLRLTLAIDPAAGSEARELAAAVAAAEPRVRLLAGEPEEDLSEWRLRIDPPATLAEGAVRNLLAAARDQDPPRPVAAASADALGAPSWVGASSLALLLAGETLTGADAAAAAAPLLALAPGVPVGPAETVALDAVVSGDGLPAAATAAALTWLPGALRDEAALATALRRRLRDPLAIAYLLPGLPEEGSGGSHSVFQEAAALRSFGVPVRIMVGAEFAARAAKVYPQAADLIEPYGSPAALEAGLDGFDVVVATEAPSARTVAEHVERHEGTIGAYYVQDYEPLFSPDRGPSADTALLSYRRAERLLLFAKTDWIGNVVASAHAVPVAKVSPSLDTSIFHARGRKADRAPVRIAAMVRPRTPRRRPAETVAALARIKRELGDRVECLSFGCKTEELEALPAADGLRHLGLLTRAEVAEVLRRSDLFLDLSTYQAFGRTGLEAMACGAVPLLPSAGGVTEYAVDGRNALLVDGGDEDAVVTAATALVEDPTRLEELRANGLEAAESFSATRAATSQYACFAGRRAALRGAR